MRDFYSPDELTGSTLAEHLVRLRHTFGVIASRLREAVARTVGQAVSRVVQQVVRTFLSRSPPGPESPLDDWEHSSDRDGLWEDDLEDRRWRDELHTEREYDRNPISPEASPPICEPPSFWRRVAVMVCRLATWWLQRRRWPYPVVTALGVGLVAGVAAYAGGPVAAAGTAMSLATLTDLVDSGAAIVFTRLP